MDIAGAQVSPAADGLPFVRRWLVLLNAGLLLAALALGLGVSRSALFLAALVPIAIVPFSYARWRLHRFLSGAITDRGTRAALAAAAIVFDVVLAAQLLTGRTSEPVPLLHWPGVAWVGPVWFSAHALLFLGYGAAGFGRSLHRLATRAGAWAARRRRAGTTAPAPATREPAAARAAVRAAPEVATPDGGATPDGAFAIDRRAFLQRAGLVGAGLPFAASLSGVPLSYDFRVEEREVAVPGWPRALDGLRVVHLSDIHVGGGMSTRRLLRMAELANAARPDLVAHTGDFLTHRRGDFDAPLYEALARIRAPHGQWACLGNHDYERPDRLVRRLRDAGVVVLRNERTALRIEGHPLELAGMEFVFGPTSRQAVYRRLVQGWGPRDGTPRLLLNHDPTAFWSFPRGAADLTLSGHTHGGHVGIQLGPSNAVTVVGLLGLPDQGLFDRDAMRLFVTRCVGFYGYPMRIGIPPEIAVLVLRSPAAAVQPV